MAVSADLLIANKVIDNGCKEYPDMPICPKIQEAIVVPN